MWGEDFSLVFPSERDQAFHLVEKSQHYVTPFNNTYKSKVQLLLQEGGLRHKKSHLLGTQLTSADVRCRVPK